MDSASPILIIDDDADIRDFISMALTDEGYTVIAAQDGIQALEMIQQTRPSLILLDVLMPQMDGWDFLSALTYTPAPRVPVIVLSAMRNVSESLQRPGIDGFLSKPFELDELLALVAQYVRPKLPD